MEIRTEMTVVLTSLWVYKKVKLAKSGEFIFLNTKPHSISGEFPVRCRMKPCLGGNKGRFSAYAKQNLQFSKFLCQ